jgi:hypothetical protein
MKTTIIILLTLISVDIFAQKRVDWKTIEIHQMTTIAYPFDKKYNGDTLYATGEKFIKIKSYPKTLADLSAKQLDKLRKSFAKFNAVSVYIDFTGLFEMPNAHSKEYFILYIVKIHN